MMAILATVPVAKALNDFHLTRSAGTVFLCAAARRVEKPIRKRQSRGGCRKNCVTAHG
jgi:hypothetical protein